MPIFSLNRRKIVTRQNIFTPYQTKSVYLGKISSMYFQGRSPVYISNQLFLGSWMLISCNQVIGVKQCFLFRMHYEQPIQQFRTFPEVIIVFCFYPAQSTPSKPSVFSTACSSFFLNSLQSIYGGKSSRLKLKQREKYFGRVKFHIKERKEVNFCIQF